MTRFLEVVQDDGTDDGRRILINLAFVEAVTDDSDGIARIVIRNAEKDGTWQCGDIMTVHSYNKIANAILDGRGRV